MLKIHTVGRCQENEQCRRMGTDLTTQLNRGYCQGHSILELSPLWVWEHRTARHRMTRAAKKGYYVAPLQRSKHVDDINAINHSLPERQGRPMSSWYRRTMQQIGDLPDYPCPHHQIISSGVWKDGELYGYCLWYICYDVAHVSMFLCHGDYLKDEIAYLLMGTLIAEATDAGCAYFAYNLHSSGTDGLRFFKERLGFRPVDVHWLL